MSGGGMIYNSIFWDNDADVAGTEQLDGTLTLNYSDVQGGIPVGMDGEGNVIPPVDPLFESGADDFRLQPTSPLIDRGKFSVVPRDELDADHDGVEFEERVPDLETISASFTQFQTWRIINECIDLGCYESESNGSDCPWDLDGDGTVGFNDLTMLLGAWDPEGCEHPCCGDLICTCPEDFTFDNSVGFADMTALIGNWGPCDESVTAMGGGGASSLEAAAAMAALMNAVAEGHLTPQQYEAVLGAMFAQ